jgi:hypothetical protein
VRIWEDGGWDMHLEMISVVVDIMPDDAPVWLSEDAANCALFFATAWAPHLV